MARTHTQPHIPAHVAIADRLPETACRSARLSDSLGPPLMSPIQVRTFDHITLVVADLERSRRFYVDLLGMEEVPRPNFTFAGKWFQLGPQQIHLIEKHDASGPAGISDKDGRTTRYQHFAFTVDDAKAAHEVLVSEGLTIVAAPKERPDGAVQVFVEDPDGHLVELCQA